MTRIEEWIFELTITGKHNKRITYKHHYLVRPDEGRRKRIVHKFDVIDFVRLLGVVVRIEMGERSEKYTREAVFNSQSNVFGQISFGFLGKNGRFLAKNGKMLIIR